MTNEEDPVDLEVGDKFFNILITIFVLFAGFTLAFLGFASLWVIVSSITIIGLMYIIIFLVVGIPLFIYIYHKVEKLL